MVTMTATFDETRIAGIQSDVSQKTAEIGGVAGVAAVRAPARIVDTDENQEKGGEEK